MRRPDRNDALFRLRNFLRFLLKIVLLIGGRDLISREDRSYRSSDRSLVIAHQFDLISMRKFGQMIGLLQIFDKSCSSRFYKKTKNSILLRAFVVVTIVNVSENDEFRCRFVHVFEHVFVPIRFHLGEIFLGEFSRLFLDRILLTTKGAAALARLVRRIGTRCQRAELFDDAELTVVSSSIRLIDFRHVKKRRRRSKFRRFDGDRFLGFDSTRMFPTGLRKSDRVGQRVQTAWKSWRSRCFA